ncbi:MAG: LptE family protein [Candidatus Polarisedimenticolia bacterium]
MRRALRFAALAVALGALAGCAGYHIAGTGGGASSAIPATAKTIAVPPFGNQTDRPRLSQRVSEALTTEIVQRARLAAVPDSRGADVILEGTIETFRADPVKFSATGRTDRVEVTVTARLRLVQASPEKVLWSQNHFVFREQYDLPATATQQYDPEILALEQIAADFARSAVTSLLEGF